MLLVTDSVIFGLGGFAHFIHSAFYLPQSEKHLSDLSDKRKLKISTYRELLQFGRQFGLLQFGKLIKS